jgi:hypothetical protein
MKQRNSTAKPVRRQVVLNFGKPNGRAWPGPNPILPEQPNSERKNAMKAPGNRAQKRGTKLKRGAAARVICYARPITRLILIDASHLAHRSLSSFVILAALKEAAVIKGVSVEDLIPPGELEQYVRVRAK